MSHDGIRPDAMEQRRLARVAFMSRKTCTLGGFGPLLLRVNDQYRSFEFHGVCGPVLLNPKGDPLDRQPSENSPFWPAFDAWRKAGAHVDAHNRAYVPSERIVGPAPSSSEIARLGGDGV